MKMAATILGGTKKREISILSSEIIRGKEKGEGWMRKHERKPYFSAVDYSVQHGTYTDFIHNISAGGLFIGTGTSFFAGEEVSMIFPLPISREQIKITGEIVWVSDMGIGVKFRTTEDKLATMIRSLVDMI